MWEWAGRGREAANEAKHCGAIERTGNLYSGDEGSGLESRKVKTSVCDWRVISTDSADVMQPLSGMLGCYTLTTYSSTYLQAKQSFKLIWACSNFLPGTAGAVVDGAPVARETS